MSCQLAFVNKFRLSTLLNTQRTPGSPLGVLQHFAQTNRSMSHVKSRDLVAPVTNLHDDEAVLAYLPHVLKYQQETFGSEKRRLPVPPLEKTLDKYLEVLSAFTPPSKLAHAEKVLRGSKTDEKLQKCQEYLQQMSKEHDNWLANWWLEQAYLAYRDSVVINVSPAALFRMPQFPDQQTWLSFAAQMVSGLWKAKQHVESEEFLDSEKKSGLCMGQYYRIFNTCRVPEYGCDKLVLYPSGATNSPKHIVVMSNEQFYVMDILDENMNLLDPSEIYHQLNHIVEDSISAPASPPVGLLTSMPRDDWTKYYEILNENETNAELIKLIHSSMFMLCLDDAKAANMADSGADDIHRATTFANNLLHGGGSNMYSGNRWFDKTYQLIVGADGYFGGLLEHSSVDGVTAGILDDLMLNYGDKVRRDVGKPAKSSSVPTRLDFVINSPEIHEGLEKAANFINEAINALDLQATVYSDYGKNFAKSHGLSPDAFFQLSLQLATFRYFSKVDGKDPSEQLLVPTYESGSLRKYRFGRTETIRSCTPAALQFARNVESKGVKDENNPHLLRRAIDAHSSYTKDAMNMGAVDRHLFGLKLAHQQLSSNQSSDPPQLFQEEFVAYANQIQLSTSQVPVKFAGFMCFGPVLFHGFGVCYNIHPDAFHIAVSTYAQSTRVDTALFIKEIHRSLDTLKEILSNSKPVSKL